MKILVTGADGFIGSHLAEELVRRGADLRAFVFYNSFNSWGWLDSSPLRHQMEIISGDVRDSGFCRKALEGVELVYNLAALIAIPFSYAAPQSYIDTNIHGALNICQAALAQGGCRVVQVSTSEVYGTALQVPISEGHRLQPQSPYSASKIGADAIAQSFWHAFQLPVVLARPFNTYGPRQSARAVIPSIITQLAHGKGEIRLGDTRPTRDFNYVSDTCAGLIAAGECAQAAGQTLNIGSGTETSIAEIFTLIQELMGSAATLIQEEQRLRPAGSEVMRLVCDSTRLRELTGWAPRIGLREGLRKTIEWFSDPIHLRRYKAERYNV